MGSFMTPFVNSQKLTGSYTNDPTSPWQHYIDHLDGSNPASHRLVKIVVSHR